MDNATELLLGNYAQLVELYERQLLIATKERYDEQLEAIQQLEEQKSIYKVAIEQLSTRKLNDGDIIAANYDTLMAYIERIQLLNAQLQQVIMDWYNEDSQTMKQVSVQRKTLQSYGGVNDSDVISYYFDERK